MGYEDHADFNPPAHLPLAFPIPTVNRVKRTSIVAFDQSACNSYLVKNVLISSKSDQAYFLKRVISSHGSEKIWAAVVLKRRLNERKHPLGVQWQNTEQVVTVKQVASWQNLSFEKRELLSKVCSMCKYRNPLLNPLSWAHTPGMLTTVLNMYRRRFPACNIAGPQTVMFRDV